MYRIDIYFTFVATLLSGKYPPSSTFGYLKAESPKLITHSWNWPSDIAGKSSFASTLACQEALELDPRYLKNSRCTYKSITKYFSVQSKSHYACFEIKQDLHDISGFADLLARSVQCLAAVPYDTTLIVYGPALFVITNTDTVAFLSLKLDLRSHPSDLEQSRGDCLELKIPLA